jgi:hypothetical protein
MRVGGGFFAGIGLSGGLGANSGSLGVHLTAAAFLLAAVPTLDWGSRDSAGRQRLELEA